ncbi:MAG: hypothetical protein AB4911_15075 [Oscillochloridaceae bacterium umkhey_bin13]
MKNSVDQLQGLLQQIGWESGRLRQQCDDLQAEFASFAQIAPEEAEARVSRVRAQLERKLHDLIATLR